MWEDSSITISIQLQHNPSTLPPMAPRMILTMQETAPQASLERASSQQRFRSHSLPITELHGTRIMVDLSDSDLDQWPTQLMRLPFYCCPIQVGRSSHDIPRPSALYQPCRRAPPPPLLPTRGMLPSSMLEQLAVSTSLPILESPSPRRPHLDRRQLSTKSASTQLLLVMFGPVLMSDYSTPRIMEHLSNRSEVGAHLATALPLVQLLHLQVIQSSMASSPLTMSWLCTRQKTRDSIGQ